MINIFLAEKNLMIIIIILMMFSSSHGNCGNSGIKKKYKQILKQLTKRQRQISINNEDDSENKTKNRKTFIIRIISYHYL